MVPNPEEGDARGPQADDAGHGENSVEPLRMATGGAVEAVGEGGIALMAKARLRTQTPYSRMPSPTAPCSIAATDSDCCTDWWYRA